MSILLCQLRSCLMRNNNNAFLGYPESFKFLIIILREILLSCSAPHPLQAFIIIIICCCCAPSNESKKYYDSHVVVVVLRLSTNCHYSRVIVCLPVPRLQKEKRQQQNELTSAFPTIIIIPPHSPASQPAQTMRMTWYVRAGD